MIDQKMYVETFSNLHAREDTLTEVMKTSAKTQRKRKSAARPAVISVLASAFILIISTISFAGSGISSIWVFHSTQKDIEQMGFSYPRQLGSYQVNEPQTRRLHTAPKGVDDITAWLQPDYTFMSLSYDKNPQERLSIDFGKMDHPHWETFWGYDKKSGIWEGALDPKSKTTRDDDTGCISYIRNLKKHQYKGCTIYIYDWITDYNTSSDKEYPIDYCQDANAAWTDPKAGICFFLQAEGTLWETSDDGTYTYIRDPEGVSQKELLSYVKTIIDSCR